MLKQYETAIAALAEAAGRSPRHRPGRQWLAAAYTQVGQVERAREEAAAVMQMEPDFTIHRIAQQHCPFNRSGDAEHLFEGLRKAGLPEK
jgi:tetratricopeptide repeat protein